MPALVLIYRTRIELYCMCIIILINFDDIAYEAALKFYSKPVNLQVLTSMFIIATFMTQFSATKQQR